MNNATISSHPETAKAPRSHSLFDYWLYLRSFLRSGCDVASLVPSSRWTAKAMLKGIDFEACQTIVELGAGTGAVTGHLLKAAEGRCRAIVLERDPAFCERLYERFPEAEIVQADALNLSTVMRDFGIERIDHIVSTLPVNWLAEKDQRRFFRSVCLQLKPQGSFRQLTHLPWAHESSYRPYFSSVRCSLILRNIPPAGCYVCRQPRVI